MMGIRTTSFAALLVGTLAATAAGFGASHVLASPAARQDAATLDLGGRSLVFRAAPKQVTSFELTFATGNAILLQPALQRLRQPDLGPYGSAGGATLYLVTATGADAKLAFERARTVRAALIRIGVAEPRAIAAVALDQIEPSAPAADPRYEQTKVTIMRVTRGACPACTATTLGTAALDTGSVKMATLTTASPERAEPQPSPTARSADRREPERNHSFTDRIPGADFEDQVALGRATRPSGPAGQASASAPATATPSAKPSPAAATASVAPPPPPRAPARAEPGEPAAQSGAEAPAPRAARQRPGAIDVASVDARALGLAGGPGCTPRQIVIDDYLKPVSAWRCPRR